FCLTCSNPSRCSALTACAPETRGSLGMLRHGEHGHQRMALARKRELGEIERRGLTKVFDRLFNRLSLSRGPGFRIQRDESALFCGCEYGSELHWRTSELHPRLLSPNTDPN